MGRQKTSAHTTQPTRAALYTRVSTDDQADSCFGLDVQEQQVRQYAGAFGLAVVASFSDPGISDKGH